MKASFCVLICVFALLFLSTCKRVETEKKDEINSGVSSDKKKPGYDHLIMATLWYQKSAEMRACSYQAYNLARFRLIENKNLCAEKSKPFAVVLDIDETVLDNSPFEANCVLKGAGYSKESWMEWTRQANADALPGAVEFTIFARSEGIEVIYISNRRTEEMKVTIDNMTALGFANADSSHLLLRTAESSKKARRETVFEKYTVLLSIGDNLADFSEIFESRNSNLGFGLVDSLKADFGTKYLIIPNPMYGEWENALYGYDFSLSESARDSLRRLSLTGF
ncbi:MAG: 5'-nucleotidase, lipoprotein e(P4) family [Bacteroidota bacterium]